MRLQLRTSRRPSAGWLLPIILITSIVIVTEAIQTPRAKSAGGTPAATKPVGAGSSAPEWPQLGGPNRNFMPDAKGLAASWPAGGPKRLWSRDLGAGHSQVIVDQGRLYTMYSRGDQEFVIALDAATGKTVWEHSYAASRQGLDLEYGEGPHATPLLVGNLLYTVGVDAKLHALDKQTGKVLWSHDLWKEFNGSLQDRGYSCSPLAYKNTVILTVGGPGQALMAFDQKTGAVVWKKQDFELSPSSPTIINVDGQEQLLTFLGDHVVGMNPTNGELLWSHPHKCDWGLNITIPVWGPDNLLFCSSAYSGGSRVLQLSQAGGKTTVKELWAGRRMRVHHGTIIRLGDLAIGSSGDFGPAPLTAVDVRTGNVVWQDRSFPKSTFVYADGKLILLDEDGNLALATLSPQGMKVISKASVLTSKAWTAPTLAGTKLYVRDRKMMMAFDLS
ncbi:MAG TPA: PQQ-binding-like beta-propeller repeat protein [Blastocatellia bacterium]|nr:PQQ-binding-like beta-propeller repeat protein [Blastocatellia bacterium]